MKIQLSILLLATAFAAVPLHADDLSRVAWLANCWAAEGGEPGSGEQWSVPAGGVMLGMARTVKNGEVASFEFMRIEAHEQGLVFVAQPQGGSPVAFPAVEITSDAVVFENPDNDFPQRVIYRLASPGVLAARIEGDSGAVDFPLRRIACDARDRYDPQLAAEIGADDYGMRRYVMAFLKRGPKQDQSKDEAAALMRAHLDNITRLADEGSLVVAGPFLDDGDVRGIYIFNVATVDEARALTETDPAIQAGRLEMELHPWYGAAALQQLLELYPRTTKQSH
ncbi:MAG: DUF6265 family protein [Gammaproteobacteria bacterium]